MKTVNKTYRIFYYRIFMVYERKKVLLPKMSVLFELDGATPLAQILATGQEELVNPHTLSVTFRSLTFQTDKRSYFDHFSADVHEQTCGLG